MLSTILTFFLSSGRRTLALAFTAMLFALSCAPTPPVPASAPLPQGKATPRFSLSQFLCTETFNDIRIGQNEFSGPGFIQMVQGSPSLPDDPLVAPVRQLIVKALDAYERSTKDEEKKLLADKLRDHFRTIPIARAQEWKARLQLKKSTDPLVQMFQRVLNNDPLMNDLLKILDRAQSVNEPPPSTPSGDAPGMHWRVMHESPEEIRAAKVKADFQAALKRGDYSDAALHFNGFSDHDIALQVSKHLSDDQLTKLREAALSHKALGGGERIVIATYLKASIHALARHEAPRAIDQNTTTDKHVDKFSEVVYDPDYRIVDGGSPSNWLQVKYPDGTQIDLHLFDFAIKSDPGQFCDHMAKAYVGAGGRVLPFELNQYTTPRLWAARQEAMGIAEGLTLDLMLTSIQAVLYIIELPTITLAMNPEAPGVTGSSLKPTRRMVTKSGAQPSARSQPVESTPSAPQQTKPSAPRGWKGPQHKFGDEIGWPKEHGGKATEVPAEKADLGKIRAAGGDEAWAREQAKIYREVANKNPNNPTATRRAEWLEKVADRLKNNSSSGSTESK